MRTGLTGNRVNPLTILLETLLPAYEGDASQLIERIITVAKSHEEDIPIEEGFELYKELVEIRRVHTEALPQLVTHIHYYLSHTGPRAKCATSRIPFAFSVEDLAAEFVWRWAAMINEQMIGWVDQAIRQDNFKVRASANEVPSDDDRHSTSVVDIFRSFNQSIDQIVKLNWGDDLQHAKFMTAMARTIGVGVARYCEIVEQKFSKEMDRLSPEQEAAANRSRQEKWMQLAKEAWSNREKIEPFQFFPEVWPGMNSTRESLTDEAE